MRCLIQREVEWLKIPCQVKKVTSFQQKPMEMFDHIARARVKLILLYHIVQFASLQFLQDDVVPSIKKIQLKNLTIRISIHEIYVVFNVVYQKVFTSFAFVLPRPVRAQW